MTPFEDGKTQYRKGSDARGLTPDGQAGFLSAMAEDVRTILMAVRDEPEQRAVDTRSLNSPPLGPRG